MNITPLRIFLPLALLVAAAAIWWPSRPALPVAAAPPAPPSQAAPVRDRADPAEASARQLVDRHKEWSAITDSAAADKIEIELKAQITDANAEAIVRDLPPALLETPFGLKALEQWAALDRAAALDWLGRQETPTRFQLATALRGWTAKDRDAVRDLAASLPAGPWRERVLAEMSTAAIQAQEPLESITQLRKMAPGETQTRLLRDSAALWAQSDPESASDWVTKVNDPALQRALIRPVAIGYAFAEPKAATEWLQQSMPAGDELNQAMGDVVAVWTGDGRAGDAAAWVAAQPEGAMRDVAVRKLVGRWREFNPAAAEAWVQSLPAGSLRKQAEDSLANPGTASR